MCQDKNEVISYYRYIIMPGQVRVRLVIKIDTCRGIEEILLLLKYRFQFGNEETFTHFKIKLRVT